MRMIWFSWSVLSRPRKIGTPEIISANIHPQDHTSIDVLYVRDPSKTSGARYQSVTTYDTESVLRAISSAIQTSFEKVFTGTPNARAKPKSPSFNSPFLLISRF